MSESTTTTSTVLFPVPEATKKQIIERLFLAGHITFNEMWTLLQDEPEVKYVPMPVEEPYNPWSPFPYTNDPLIISDDTDNPKLYIGAGGTGDFKPSQTQ